MLAKRRIKNLLHSQYLRLTPAPPLRHARGDNAVRVAVVDVQNPRKQVVSAGCRGAAGAGHGDGRLGALGSPAAGFGIGGAAPDELSRNGRSFGELLLDGGEKLQEARGRNDVVRRALAGAAAGNGDDAPERGEGIGVLQFLDVDELAELQPVAEDHVVLLLGERDVQCMRCVGDFEEEASVGPEIAFFQNGDDASDL